MKGTTRELLTTNIFPDQRKVYTQGLSWVSGFLLLNGVNTQPIESTKIIKYAVFITLSSWLHLFIPNSVIELGVCSRPYCIEKRVLYRKTRANFVIQFQNDEQSLVERALRCEQEQRDKTISDSIVFSDPVYKSNWLWYKSSDFFHHSDYIITMYYFAILQLL